MHIQGQKFIHENPPFTNRGAENDPVEQFTLLLAHIPMSPHVCKSKTGQKTWSVRVNPENAQQQIQRERPLLKQKRKLVLVKYLQPIRKGICMGLQQLICSPLYFFEMFLICGVQSDWLPMCVEQNSLIFFGVYHVPYFQYGRKLRGHDT